MVTTRAALYLVLVALVALQRLFELRLSKRNCARARAAGAIELGREHYPWMVLLHGSFLAFCAIEVVLFDRPFMPSLATVSLAVLVVATVLRYAAIRELGERWTTRVFHWPELPLVGTGPYRFVRHPNYLAVALEMAALPLVHSAWVTSLLFSALNTWLLAVRIRVESTALAAGPAVEGEFSATPADSQSKENQRK